MSTIVTRTGKGSALTWAEADANFTNLNNDKLETSTAAATYTPKGAIGSSGLTMSTAKILGRTTASTGAPEEITVGTGLSLSTGALDASGTLSQSVALSGDISPTQITANQNDYNPTNLATSSVLRLTTDASRDVTGLQGGADGRIIIIHNVGSFAVVLKDESANSSAANRFALTGDTTLLTDQAILLQYDSTSSRWRAVTSPFSASSVTGIGNGRTTDITISSAGEVTMPLQPAFLAYNSATDANVTGDNTSYTVICDTEVFDQNGDYNAGTGVFTAPVTGRYRLTFRVLLAELAAAHVTQNLSIIASNRTFNVQDIFPGGANPFTQRQFEINCLVDMDSGDTAYPTVQIAGGTKVVDVYGGASNNFTSFMGELVA